MTCFRLASGETLRSYCKRNKLCYEALFDRLDNGMTVEEAIEDYLPRRGRKDNNVKYFYKGKSLAAYFKVGSSAYQQCRKLILDGMSVEEAVKAVLEKKKGGG